MVAYGVLMIAVGRAMYQDAGADRVGHTYDSTTQTLTEPAKGENRRSIRGRSHAKAVSIYKSYNNLC